MNANTIRETFLDFFKAKQHGIVQSAPMVVKNDPTLMFTNAGMNQFKDIFLGNQTAKNNRIADTQKCLRVSGKHNDLEEVGHDTYHHTMFEMLGNWSFGDYFKQEAIEWGWELLTKVYKIDTDRLYVTVFGGDEKDGLAKDDEAIEIWKKIVPENRIILGSKKDNFWEMGDTGPCGPCSEIHIDLRTDEDRKKIDGYSLINQSHNLVIEIWNLVFMEFNRMSNGSLVPLAQKHVDTGMGFERLCMVVQGKTSNYDTDVFQPIIKEIAKWTGKEYGKDEKANIAMRVIADHLRAIAFAIADGQLPSNNKAGYVIRRILRRAVRYGYTFLGFKEPFLFDLVPLLVENMGGIFPELKSQQDLIKKVIAEEEFSFLKTLATGISRFENYIKSHTETKTVEGTFAFELFDTYGFPVDLTQLMAKEQNYDVDMKSFTVCMEEQKQRSRNAAAVDTEDWVVIKDTNNIVFVGYEKQECDAHLVKYRKVKTKDKAFFQLVFDVTPFYAESGGQAGDKGIVTAGNEQLTIENTIKENDLIIHLVKKLPKELNQVCKLIVDKEKRLLTENNHSATHLLHAALRQVVGTHVEQKGSSVNHEHLRFDFSHFAKLTIEEIAKIEALVNQKIRENIALEEMKNVPIADAQKMGATALFGEKYGDSVRVISFDRKFSIELCGGTHVKATGQIGLFKIISESAIAAGVRRIEAITADSAEAFYNSQSAIVDELKVILKAPKDIVKSVEALQLLNNQLLKQLEEVNKQNALQLKSELIKAIEDIKGIQFISSKVTMDAANIKELAFEIKKSVENLFLIIGGEFEGKASLTIAISENLVKEKAMNAGALVKELAKEINGGGGGQSFLASAGGTNPAGIDAALAKAKAIVTQV